MTDSDKARAEALAQEAKDAEAAGDYARAEAAHAEALALCRKLYGEKKSRVADHLHGLGRLAYLKGEFTQARELGVQSLEIRRELLGPRHIDVAKSLNNLGLVAHDLGDYPAARAYHLEALDIRREVLGPRHPDVASSLNNLGSVPLSLGDYPAARAYHLEALDIRREVLGPLHADTAQSLNHLGSVAHDLGDYPAARAHYLEALDIRRELLGPRHTDVAISLNNLGSVAHDLGDYPAARAHYLDALDIFRDALGPRHTNVAHSLANLGDVARDLGDYPAARAYDLEALDIRREVLGPRHDAVASSLRRLGIHAHCLGDYSAARAYHLEALDIEREAVGPRHPDVAASINNLGAIARDLSDYPAAQACHLEALDIRREALGSDHPNLTFSYLGLAQTALHQSLLPEALSQAAEALRIRLLPDRGAELYECYDILARIAAAAGHAESAIFFGKLAVNTIQAQRATLKSLEPELQRAFLNARQESYHRLVGRLIEAGRLGEAQQVLAMLKEEEMFDLVRRKAARDPRLTRAGLTAAEEAARKDLDAIAARLVADFEAAERLRALEAPGEAEITQLAALEAARAEHVRVLTQWVEEVYRHLAPNAHLAEEVAAINRELLSRLQAQLKAIGPGTALASYIPGKDRLSILFTTVELQTHREGTLSAAALAKDVQDFRLAIEERLGTTRRLSRQLHDQLIGPIADLLATHDVKTLLVVPLGALRYLPFAALHDGERYLAERLAVSVVTLAAQSGMVAEPRADWTVAGLGVERAVDGYDRLAAVADELYAIADDPDQARPLHLDEAGIYPGIIRLDEAFTEPQLTAALSTHAVLHMASHFNLDPARGLNSTLLLGDGTHLPLERLCDPEVSFEGVELVTLSACETGIGQGDEAGREFEGFGALIQSRGAKAVLASLWPVADASTAPLMTEFYRAHRSGKSKSAALQAAQIAFINRSDAYKHPYHWAPFILMGNPR